MRMMVRVRVKIAEGFARGKQRPPRPSPAVRITKSSNTCLVAHVRACIIVGVILFDPGYLTGLRRDSRPTYSREPAILFVYCGGVYFGKKFFLTRENFFAWPLQSRNSFSISDTVLSLTRLFTIVMKFPSALKS